LKKVQVVKNQIMKKPQNFVIMKRNYLSDLEQAKFNWDLQAQSTFYEVTEQDT